MPSHEPLDVAPLLDPEVKAALAQIPIDIGSIMGSLSDDSIALVRELFGATPAPAAVRRRHPRVARRAGHRGREGAGASAGRRGRPTAVSGVDARRWPRGGLRTWR